MGILNKDIIISRSNEQYFLGEVGLKDSFGDTITDTFIDGKTVRGPWAIMTPMHHGMYGVGLGVGKGQKYELTSNGRWLKVG
jgi:hypothetical protein